MNGSNEICGVVRTMLAADILLRSDKKAMEAPDADAEATVAADILCSLRSADLAGCTPPWCKPAAPPPQQEGELIWPAVVRGKRSRRRSPSAGTDSGKGRWGRGSPASPLDYSGASTSGGEDGAFCSPPEHRRAPTTNKVGSIGEPQLIFPTPLPRPNGQRPRKKLKLPEVQQLVMSLEVENKRLREEMRALQRACTVLSKENDKLETKLDQSNSCNENASKEQKGKQQVDQRSVVQSARDSFVLPDLNLPPQDTADVSLVH